MKTLKQLLIDDCPYLAVYKFLKKRGVVEANLLSFLIDANSYASCRLVEDTTYFQCSDSFIQSQLELSSPTIKKYIDKFVNEGLIYKRMQKINSAEYRFVKVNEQKLIQLYNEYKKELVDKEDEITLTYMQRKDTIF